MSSLRDEAVAAGAPAVAIAIGVAMVAGGLVGAEIGGPPYWRWSDPNSWLIAVAVGLFVALFAVPFAIRRIAPGGGQSGTWGPAMLWWLGVALGVCAVGGLLVAAAGLGSASLLGITGLVMVCEGAVVVALVALQLLAG